MAATLSIKRRFLRLGAVILLLLTLGTAGFSIIEGFGLFDAFYMSLITMTTIGYKEVNDLGMAGRIFNSLFIIVSVTTLFLAIGIMTQTAIELELRSQFRERRIKRMINKMERHFIVCGLGRVGLRASEQLHKAGVSFVIIEKEPDLVEQALRLGMVAVAADATRDQTLQEVGVDRAQGLIAALSTDADNLFIVLSAKALNPKLRIAARAAEEDAAQKLRRAGADIVYAPYVSAGVHLAQSLLRPHVTQFFDFTFQGEGPEVSLEQVPVMEESQFVSKSLAELQLRRDLGVVVLGIRRASGQMVLNPQADFRLSAGDFLIVMGEHPKLRQLENLLSQQA